LKNSLVFITKLEKKACHPMVKFESFINTYTHTMYFSSILIHEIRIQPRTRLCVVWNRPAGAPPSQPCERDAGVAFRSRKQRVSDGNLVAQVGLIFSFTQLYTSVLFLGFLTSSVFAELALHFSLCVYSSCQVHKPCFRVSCVVRLHSMFVYVLFFHEIGCMFCM
jgi:hypothetical protein